MLNTHWNQIWLWLQYRLRSGAEIAIIFHTLVPVYHYMWMSACVYAGAHRWVYVCMYAHLRARTRVGDETASHTGARVTVLLLLVYFGTSISYILAPAPFSGLRYGSSVDFATSLERFAGASRAGQYGLGPDSASAPSGQASARPGHSVIQAFRPRQWPR